MTLTLLDWRRRVAASLRRRAGRPTDPEAGWRAWRDGRDELFAGHPRLPAGRGGAGGVPRAAVRAVRPGAALRGRAGTGRAAAAGAADRGRRRRAAGPDRHRRARRAGARWTCGGSAGTAAGSSCRCATAAPGRTHLRRRPLPARHRSRAPTWAATATRLVVDLNFAYHPSCTYDPRWSCPLAPEGNRLTAPGRRRGAVAPRRLVLTGSLEPRSALEATGRSSTWRGRRRS